MRAGTLRHKITFKENQSVKNSVGEKVEVLVDVLETWASIQTVSGKEQFLSNQIYSEMTHKLRVRYSSLIKAGQVISFGARRFEMIAAPMNIFEKNKELEILVKEIV